VEPHGALWDGTCGCWPDLWRLQAVQVQQPGLPGGVECMPSASSATEAKPPASLNGNSISEEGV
jgi:hypothetical protein